MCHTCTYLRKQSRHKDQTLEDFKKEMTVRRQKILNMDYNFVENRSVSSQKTMDYRNRKAAEALK